MNKWINEWMNEWINKWISECLDPGEYPQLAEADLPTLAPPVFTSATRDHRKTILRESGDTVRSVKSFISLKGTVNIHSKWPVRFTTVLLKAFCDQELMF